MPARGDDLVLIDRTPAAVLSWVRLATAEVTRQLSVATGFLSNPPDYAEISPTQAYVPRFDPNPAPGQVPFDGGGDVLAVDPSIPAITGRIDLAPVLAGEAPRFLPHPERVVVVGGRAYVTVSAFTADFLESASSRLVAIDPATDAIGEVLLLTGLHGCASVAVAPDESELAVGCTGDWGGDSNPDPATSGLVRVGLQDGLVELGRYSVASLGAGPVGLSVAYADSRRLELITLGSYAPPVPDALVELDVATGASHTVLSSLSEPFTLGDVTCVAPCGVCFVADAGRDGGVVHRFELGASGLVRTLSIRAESTIGLPPRELGAF